MKIKAIIAAVAIGLCGIIAAPIVLNAINDYEEDEAKKEPIQTETETVELLDVAKTPEDLGVKNVSLKLNGESSSLYLDSGSVKFEAGFGASGFVANVSGFGSVKLDYESRRVYTEDTRYELYTLTPVCLTPGVGWASSETVTVDLYAQVGDRLYLIATKKATIDGMWFTEGFLGEPDLLEEGA